MAPTQPANNTMIAHEEVLQYVYDFLQASGYRNALYALQAESGVPYNTIITADADPSDRNNTQPRRKRQREASASEALRESYAAPSEASLERAVMQGAWGEVLHVYVEGLLLPVEVKTSLYELIFEELLHLHGLQPAARTLFYNSPVFAEMRLASPARYSRLETMLASFDKVMWDEQHQHRSSTTSASGSMLLSAAESQSRRENILRHLRALIRFSPATDDGSLAAALVMLRAAESSPVDGAVVPTGLPRGSAPQPKHMDEHVFLAHPVTAPSSVVSTFAYDQEKSVAAVCTLPTSGAEADGGSEVLMLVGRCDGIVDFVNPQTGSAVGASVAHTSGVFCITLDEPRAAGGVVWMAVGYRDGWVKVYNASTHKLVRRFSQVHSMGVTTAVFCGPIAHTNDGMHGHSSYVASGSFDGTIHVLSFVTGNSIYRIADGHHSTFIHALCHLREVADESSRPSYVMSAGNDGMLNFWGIDDTSAAAKIQDASSTARVARRLGTPMALRSLDATTFDGTAVPTNLIFIPGDSTSPTSSLHCEVLIASQSVGDVLLVAITGSTDLATASAEGLSMTPLCLLRGSRPVRSLSALVNNHSSLSSLVPTSTLPVLTLYVVDDEGTVSLYNTDMKWRGDTRGSVSGVIVVPKAVDQSGTVLLELGRSVSDGKLAVARLASQLSQPWVMVFSPSMPSLYVLQ